MKNKHFLILIVIGLGLITAAAMLQGCNDTKVTPKPNDSTVINPLPIIDTEKIDTPKPHINALVDMSKLGGENLTQFAINLNEVGVLPSNTAEQNTKSFEDFIFSKPVGFAGALFLPNGDYQFAHELKIYERPVHLFGENGTVWGQGTHLHFPSESMGIVILRGQSASQETIIENLALFNTGNKNPWMDGFVIRGRVTLRNVFVKGFYNGIEAACNISEGNDASGSYIAKCFSAENTNNGFHFQGMDCNAITVIGSDSRDNGSFGFYDGSFLGNSFISCMSHANAKGHYFVLDKNNARTNIIGAYCEGGVPASQLSTKTTVTGGIWPDGYDLLDGKGIQYK